MDLFTILPLLGGVGMFLFGMNLMGQSLKNLAGGSLQKILEKLTTGKSQASGALKGFALGTGVTAIIQSSAATTIMLIGFVNAGIMKLAQAIPVVFGANVGSTATAQILRLGDLAENNVFLKLLKPSSFAPILICIGAFIILFTKKSKQKEVACILVGLGILFYGMNAMEGVFAPLKDSEQFRSMFVSFSNPFLGILIGLVLTAIIQSSSASVGILQAMSTTGAVTYGVAIPVIIGMNIGKCMTILLGSIGANKKAKRVSLSYLLFNIFGTIFFVIVIYGLKTVIDMPFMEDTINRGGIANIHLGFNLIMGIILLPFVGVMANITGKLVRDDEESKIDKELATLDERLIDTPTIAISQARKVMFSMADTIKENFAIGSRLISNYNEDDAKTLLENEDFIDKCESALNSYLLKVTSRNNLDRNDRRLSSELLNSISDLERIGDHCETLLDVSRNIVDEKISFSEQGSYEIHMALDATSAIIDMTFDAFKTDNLQEIAKIEPLSQTIEEIKELIKEHHVNRLQTGACGIPGGFALVDILTGLDRIAGHCKNIGHHVAKKHSIGEVDEMHGPMFATEDKSSDQYKAYYGYYVSQYLAPIAGSAEGDKKEEKLEESKAVEKKNVDKKSVDKKTEEKKVSEKKSVDKKPEKKQDSDKKAHIKDDAEDKKDKAKAKKKHK